MRLDWKKLAPEAYQAMTGINRYNSTQQSIEPRLRALVEMRVSQMNGCAFCLDLHAREARQHGEAQLRLDVLPAWSETELFDEREKACLAWAEELTLVGEGHVPDYAYEEARQVLDEEEIVDLSLIVGMMNFWNRMSVAFRAEPTGK